MRSAELGAPPSAQQTLILLEASRKRALGAIAGSWKSVRSALFAWGEFCDCFGYPHFPPNVVYFYFAWAHTGQIFAAHEVDPYVPRVG